MCLNACFTQKNDKQPYRDPPREHPKTVFVPEEDAESWRIFIESVRPTRFSKKSRTSMGDEDGYEGSMKVPKSVLDGCEESFTAADGVRQKASTQFFSSTALMGLMCCHDRVLWLVNMTTPGE